ncbi:hypothetical protein FOCC_FOCC015558 [Frankliniella occidentalis]|nr:hypothetical protein FOCC_FOCC015558 [Frankliniella occidentalis]
MDTTESDWNQGMGVGNEGGLAGVYGFIDHRVCIKKRKWVRVSFTVIASRCLLLGQWDAQSSSPPLSSSSPPQSSPSSPPQSSPSSSSPLSESPLSSLSHHHFYHHNHHIQKLKEQ